MIINETDSWAKYVHGFLVRLRLAAIRMQPFNFIVMQIHIDTLVYKAHHDKLGMGVLPSDHILNWGLHVVDADTER